MATAPSVMLPDVGSRLAVLCDASSVSIIGVEGAARIRFEADGASGKLVSSGRGGDVVVAEGSTAQIIDMFAQLRSQAVPPRRGRSLRSATTGVAASVLVLLAVGGGIVGFRATQTPAFDGAALQRVLNATQGARLGMPTPENLPGMQASAARSVPMPAEMPSLDDAPLRKAAPAASTAPKGAAATVRFPEPPAKGTGVYPGPNAVSASSAATDAKGTGTFPGPNAAPAPVAAAPAPIAAAASDPAPVDAKAGEAKPEPRDAAATETPKPVKAPTGPEAIAAAIARMNPYEAQRAVKTLDDIKTSLSDTGEISPELLREIPHEIAMALRDAGVNLTPGERREAGRKSVAVVRLPASAIETFRGRDGIASVPDSNSWVLTDGNVRLPLPGGGDIRTVEAMTDFGLKP